MNKIEPTGHHPTSEFIDPTSGDPLSEVLQSIRLRSAYFFLWNPKWPYDTGVPNGEKFSDQLLPGADQVISYHIVLEGPCWGCVEGEPPMLLESGDIMLLPHGDAYVIGSEPRPPNADDEAPALAFFEMLAAGKLPPVIEDGGDGPQQNRVICGFLGCDMKPFNPMLNTLPRILKVPALGSGSDPLSSMIDFALSESMQPQQGARCVLSRLSEVMFVEVIRRYLRSQQDAFPGWLGGLRDPVVGAALGCLHQEIGFPWTLENLALRVGSSRSTLADRFSNLVGIPPMQYLTQWRMQIAARKLADGAGKNFAIAQEVGYDSEASFSRAFKRVVGMSPSEWRENRLVK